MDLSHSPVNFKTVVVDSTLKSCEFIVYPLFYFVLPFYNFSVFHIECVFRIHSHKILYRLGISFDLVIVADGGNSDLIFSVPLPRILRE